MAYYDDQDYGVDPNGNPRQRSRISSFAADGRGNFSSTFSGPETGGAMVRRDWGADFDPQAQVGADFDGIAQRAAAVKRHNAQLGNWSLNAAMKSALGNGGRVPQNQVDLLTRNLGMDGRNRAVWRAGFLQNGDFAVDVAERGQNGGVSTTTMRIPRADQRRMMLDAPGVWGDAGVARYRELGDALSSTLGRSELGDPEAYSGALQRYRSGQSARQAQAAEAQRMQLVKSIIDQVSKDGDRRNPEQDVRFRLLTDKNLGPVYRRGKPVLNEKGEQELDDEGNPKFEEATPEEVKAKLEHDVALVMGGQQGRDDDFDRRAQWAMSVINHIYPQQPVNPRMREMQDRLTEDALYAQRRSEVTRFPQRYIRYRDASGREVAANGYVTNDGRVYDANGYEIEGATAARSPYDNALPPIRALDGGRQSAQTPASAVQEQGVEERPRPPAGGAEFVTRNGRGWQWRNGEQGWKYYPVREQGAAAAESVSPNTAEQGAVQFSNPGEMPATGFPGVPPYPGASLDNAEEPNAAEQSISSAQTPTENAAPTAQTTDEFVSIGKEIGNDVLNLVRERHPEWTAESIRAGEHDHEITRIGESLRGDSYRSPDYAGRKHEAEVKARQEAKRKADEERYAQMQARLDDREKRIIANVHKLFDDDLKAARDWAVENRTKTLFGTDNYETSVRKKFGELMEKRIKEQGLQIYSDATRPSGDDNKSDFDNYNFPQLIQDIYGIDVPMSIGRGGAMYSRNVLRKGKRG